MLSHAVESREDGEWDRRGLRMGGGGKGGVRGRAVGSRSIHKVIWPL